MHLKFQVEAKFADLKAVMQSKDTDVKVLLIILCFTHKYRLIDLPEKSDRSSKGDRFLIQIFNIIYLANSVSIA